MRVPPVSPVGDRAVLAECVDHVDARELAAVVRDARVDGVTDVVPAERSVLIIFAKPTARAAGIDAVRAAIAGGEAAPAGSAGSLVELPTKYDGADLDEVARLAGLSRDEVVRRHAAAEYTVMFIGFLPGFAYLDGLDPALVVGRRDSPRTRVPAGSVAIAAGMAAVYPRESPGGWQVLGKTSATMFDPDRPQPSLLEAGTRVRFVPR
jgi:KipI family sensor histidine kinase inhibitor